MMWECKLLNDPGMKTNRDAHTKARRKTSRPSTANTKLLLAALRLWELKNKARNGSGRR